MLFPDQDSTNFPVSVKNILNNAVKEYSDKDFLRYHQFIIYMYLIKNTKSRGLMLFHDMGMGKSISAVALAEYYREHEPDRKIIVLLSKSLQENFKKNISRFIKEKNLTKLKESEIDDVIDTKYKFVSLNASNMFEQLKRVDKTDEELLFEKQIEEFTEVVEKSDFLENSLLIIDEFHNLSNSITNGSTNAMKLYDRIMGTKDIKLLFLTGTPIINNPFELVPTFNMLRGTIQTDNTSVTLFPELQKDFDSYFIDAKTNVIKNKDRLQNRIFGLCSYYGNLYFGKNKKQGFPKELPLIVVRVPMSATQFSRYNAARDSEIEESAVKIRPSRAERFTSKNSISSSYRVKSRQFSNYVIPEYALGPIRGMKSRLKYIDKISSKDLLNTDEFSPKFGKVLENIANHANQLGLVYSEFVSGEGIAIFEKILELRGYISWKKNKEQKENMDLWVDGGWCGDESSESAESSSESDESDESSENGESDGNKTVTGGLKLLKKKKEKKHPSKQKEKKKSQLKPKQKHKQKHKKKNTYAIISGDITVEERTLIINAFNDKNNSSGKYISLLLISKTGAEGLDLKRVRHIHIIEPYWNAARQEQIIARGVRYLSHVDMPKSEQNVQTYMYLSDYPVGYDIKKKKEDTTDVHLYNMTVKNKILISQFLVCLAEASIDCSMHEPNFDASVRDEIHCKLCAVTNTKLYHPLIAKDMMLPDPCKKLTTEEISAKEIDVDGEKYYYTDDFNIFKFNKDVNGYILLQSHEPHYADIIKKLLMD